MSVRHQNVKKRPVTWAITVGVVNLLHGDIPVPVDVPRAVPSASKKRASDVGNLTPEESDDSQTPDENPGLFSLLHGNNTGFSPDSHLETGIIPNSLVPTLGIYRGWEHIPDIL